jgi:hypothetical protein
MLSLFVSQQLRVWWCKITKGRDPKWRNIWMSGPMWSDAVIRRTLYSDRQNSTCDLTVQVSTVLVTYTAPHQSSHVRARKSTQRSNSDRTVHGKKQVFNEPGLAVGFQAFELNDHIGADPLRLGRLNCRQAIVHRPDCGRTAHGSHLMYALTEHRSDDWRETLFCTAAATVLDDNDFTNSSGTSSRLSDTVIVLLFRFPLVGASQWQHECTN